MLKKIFPQPEDSRLTRISKILSVFLFVVVCLYSAVYAVKRVRAFPNSILSFSPASLSVAGNEAFVLDATLDPRTNQVTAVSLSVTFDAAKFQLDGINTEGSPLNVTLLPARIDNAAGTAAIDLGIYPGAAPLTSPSKLASFSFRSLGSETGSSTISFTTDSMAAALNEGAMDVITERRPAAITVDTTAPIGGSIVYNDGSSNTASAAVAVGDGSDAISGVDAATRIIQRKSAVLSGTSCGTFGEWGSVTMSGSYPNFTDATLANGNCYQYQYLVSDNVGNQAVVVGTGILKVDTAAPVLAQVAAVPELTNDTTPNYVFSSSEAGTIGYAGDCSSAATEAAVGENLITFDTLSSATHSNCTIRVTDAAGNQSAILAVNAFTVDAIVPKLTQKMAVADVVTDATPLYIFNSSKAGAIDFDGDCSSATSSAVSGDNTIIFDELPIGNHANCSITVTDQSGNVSEALQIEAFAITYPGDFNLDRKVDLFDYNLAVTNYGDIDCGNAADFNMDCKVNLFDYNAMLQDYGKSF